MRITDTSNQFLMEGKLMLLNFMLSAHFGAEQHNLIKFGVAA
jgi:hypothetical protein